MTHPVIRKRFMSLLGVDKDYIPGEVIEIRGKQYRFPSFTAIYDVGCRGGSIAEYQVK